MILSVIKRKIYFLLSILTLIFWACGEESNTDNKSETAVKHKTEHHQLYQVKEIAPAGIWLWFNSEHIIFNKDKMFIGCVDKEGYTAVYVVKMDTVPLISKKYRLSSWNRIDDHIYPSLSITNDNKILAVYSKTPFENQFYYRLCDIPKNSTSIESIIWSEEKIKKLANGVSYNNIFYTDPGKKRLSAFFSNYFQGPSIVFSDDDGKSWGQDITYMQIGESKTAPYSVFCSNGRGRVDMLYSDGHPREDETNSIYHIYFQNERIYKSDGTEIITLKEAAQYPIKSEDGTLIYDGRTSGRAWTWDIEYTQDGLAAAYISSADSSLGNDLRYRFALWDSTEKKWSESQIAFAGTKLFEPENHMAGGITIDPQSSNTVYISADINPENGKFLPNNHYQIFKGTKATNVWKWQQLTFNTDCDNLRPVVPLNHNYKNCVIWVRGEYNSCSDFQTGIVGVLDK